MVLRQIWMSTGALRVALTGHHNSAQALSMKECSAKYKAAKEGDSRWHDVERLPQSAMRGGSNRRTEAFGGVTASSGPTGENDAARAGGNWQRGISQYRFAQILW
jgi:hypothetical protein